MLQNSSMFHRQSCQMTLTEHLDHQSFLFKEHNISDKIFSEEVSVALKSHF
jgi:hypothetical protein